MLDVTQYKINFEKKTFHTYSSLLDQYPPVEWIWNSLSLLRVWASEYITDCKVSETTKMAKRNSGKRRL